MAWVLDLDGVLWLADVAVPGSADAVARLRAAGEQVCFVTNNSSQPASGYVAKLRGMGVGCERHEVVTSAEAAAATVDPDEVALVCAGDGVVEALEARGVRVVRDGPADVVVVGWHLDFDFSRLAAAVAAVDRGARLLGTNDDATYPTPDGPLPGGGAILAAVAYASGATPVVAGKPHPPMVDLVRRRVGEVAVVVGDRPATDGLLAKALGARFAMVRSGVTGADPRPAPDVVGDDLASVVGLLLPPLAGGSGGR